MSFYNKPLRQLPCNMNSCISQTFCNYWALHAHAAACYWVRLLKNQCKHKEHRNSRVKFCNSDLTFKAIILLFLCHLSKCLSSMWAPDLWRTNSANKEKNREREKKAELAGESHWSRANRIPCSWVHRRKCWEDYNTSLQAQMSNIPPLFFANKHCRHFTCRAC